MPLPPTLLRQWLAAVVAAILTVPSFGLPINVPGLPLTQWGAKMVHGILSCCEKSNLTGCKEQPFNVDCKKKGWTETCCLKEKMGVDKNGGGGKCSKQGDKFTTLAN
jgi:hypothetical protein